MQDSGERKEFPGGGMRDASLGKERPELAWTAEQPYEDQMLTRYGHWMARGAEKYESRNWEQFDSEEALEHAKGSLLRHTFKLLAGQTDEDHAAAVWFNVQAIELIRWKLREKTSADVADAALKAAYDAATEPENKPKDPDTPRYFRDTSEGAPWYYRWVFGTLTLIREISSRREVSAYKDPEVLEASAIPGSLTEIPVDEVPRWAR